MGRHTHSLTPDTPQCHWPAMPCRRVSIQSTWPAGLKGRVHQAVLILERNHPLAVKRDSQEHTFWIWVAAA